MFQKKLTVSVGIAAYNSDNVIKSLIKSIQNQRQRSFVLKQIIVHSDCSNDNTVEVVKDIQDKLIILIDSKKRKGFAGSVKILCEKHTSDILMLLNDDIVIKNSDFIEKSIEPFINRELNIGLSCVNIVPISSKNFIESAANTGFSGYYNFAKNYRNGSNLFTCDGKVLILSELLVKRINFPKNMKDVGNLDIFLYFECIKNKFSYYYNSSANVFFKFPSTLKDFIKWQVRNYNSTSYIKQRTPKFLQKEFKYPKLVLLSYKLKESLKNPLGGVFIFLIGLYCFVLNKSNSSEFNPLWEVITTTKHISQHV